jgi:hypothetical protein
VSCDLLGRDDVVSERPFCDPARTADDTATLELVRAGLRLRVAGGNTSGRWQDRGGATHLTVVPAPAALAGQAPATAIGFFGQARVGIDHSAILDLEHAILRRATSFRGLLAYDNVFFPSRRQWANLVVFVSDDDPAALAGDPEHLSAVALAPAHYSSLRLHRFRLLDGIFGSAPLAWRRTTYLDFADDPPWRAVRVADR